MREQINVLVAEERHLRNLIRANTRLNNQMAGLCCNFVEAKTKKELWSRAGTLLKKVRKDPAANPYLVQVLQPYEECRVILEHHIKGVKKTMAAAFNELPVAPWVEGVRGVSATGMACIVGESGDLDDFPTVAKLYKWFGLHVEDGRAQTIKLGKQLNHSPHRRAVVWAIGNAIVKQGDYYRQVFLDRKAYEKAKTPDERDIVTHLRAKRYMEKKLLADFKRNWGG